MVDGRKTIVLLSRLMPRRGHAMNSLGRAPYPIECLPTPVGDLVLRVALNCQVQPEHVAAVAIGAMSAAIQDLIDVQTPYGDVVPPSQYVCVILKSGDRASAMTRQVNLTVEEFDGRVASWTPDLPVDQADQLEPANACHQFLYEDASAPAILDAMHAGAKSIYIAGDEGSNVLKLLDIPTACKWWNAASIRHNRRSVAPIVLHDRRVSLCIQIQRAHFDRFMSKKGDIAVHSGLFPRMLFARPDSLQGSRFRAPYASLPLDTSNSAFNGRMRQLFQENCSRKGSVPKQRPTMQFDSAAASTWTSFYNHVETQLGQCGVLADIPAFASKAPEIAARLAGLFEYFSNGSHCIQTSTISAACNLVWWHLIEAKQEFGAPCPAQVAQMDAANLLDWLHQRAAFNPHMKGFTKSYLLRYGLTPLRKIERLEPALYALQQAGHVAIGTTGRTQVIYLRGSSVLQHYRPYQPQLTFMAN